MTQGQSHKRTVKDTTNVCDIGHSGNQLVPSLKYISRQQPSSTHCDVHRSKQRGCSNSSSSCKTPCRRNLDLLMRVQQAAIRKAAGVAEDMTVMKSAGRSHQTEELSACTWPVGTCAKCQ